MAYSNVQTGVDPSGQPIYSSGSGAAPASVANNTSGTTPTSGGSAVPGSSTDPFIQALQSKLLAQSDLISSSNSGIDDKIQAAIQGVQSANDSSNQAIGLDYTRQEQDTTDTAAFNRNNVVAAARGYGQNVAALNQLDTQTQKSLRDLDMRKQELQMQGDATAAGKVADLQLQALQFQQTAQQNVFSNLLSIGSFGVQAQQLQQAQNQQNFAEKSAISQVALQYGLTVQPGDTIDSITSRAAPLASQAQKLQLDQIRSQINANNATAAKALSDAAASKTLDDTQITSLANAYLTKGDAVLGQIKDPNSLAAVINKSVEIQKQQYTTAATNDLNTGVTKNAAIAAVSNNSNLNANQKADSIAAINSVYATAPAKKNTKNTETSIGGPFASFVDLMNSFGDAVLPATSR